MAGSVMSFLGASCVFENYVSCVSMLKVQKQN